MSKVTRSFMVSKTLDGKYKWNEVEPRPEPELTDEQKSATIEFWNEPLNASVAGCIGCGYCCAKAPCELASRSDCWDLETGCNALRWDGKRHLCQFYLDDPETVSLILAIGWGCSSSLFNSYREKVRNLVGTRLK